MNCSTNSNGREITRVINDASLRIFISIEWIESARLLEREWCICQGMISPSADSIRTEIVGLYSKSDFADDLLRFIVHQRSLNDFRRFYKCDSRRWRVSGRLHRVNDKASSNSQGCKIFNRMEKVLRLQGIAGDLLWRR